MLPSDIQRKWDGSVRHLGKPLGYLNGNDMGFPRGQVCVYSGAYSQAGRMGDFRGTYSCSTGEVGNMAFFEMTNRVGMLSGRLEGPSTNIGCHYTGRFTGLDPSKP